MIFMQAGVSYIWSKVCWYNTCSEVKRLILTTKDKRSKFVLARITCSSSEI